MSPGSRIRRPATSARSTSEELFGSERVPRSGAGGASTSSSSGPYRAAAPVVAATVGSRRLCAARTSRTSATPLSGSPSWPVTIRSTRRPWSTPASPPTWSRWKWVITRAAISVTCSPRRQRSTATGSGPASTCTARPGPAGSTSASPWPTSQATSTQPGGGHPGASERTGTCTRTPTSTAAASTRAGPPRRARPASSAVAASSSTAPRPPAGQDRLAPGSAPARSATSTSHRHGQPANQASNWPAGSHAGATAAAAKPSTVATGTAGSASTLAGTATRLIRPDSIVITGAVTRWAAAATASASASPGGTRRERSAVAQPGASRSSDAVARTDMAKPASRASRASCTSSASTVAASAGTACRGRPVASETRATAAISAARSTLGEGRATSTKATSTTAPASAHAHGRSRARRSTSSVAPTTMEQLVPLTATRWVSPATRNRSTSTGSRPAVSPSTSPGSRPRSCGGRGAAAARNRARTVPAARCHHGGWPSRAGGRRANSVTPVAPRSDAGRRLPSTSTRWPGSTVDQPRAGPSTSTGTDTAQRVPPALTRTERVVTATRDTPDSPVPASRCGSASTTSSALTEACRSASSVVGAARACHERAAHGSSTAAMQHPAAPTTRQPRLTGRRSSATAALASPASATAANNAGGRPNPTSRLSHAAAAPPASRRSVPPARSPGRVGSAGGTGGGPGGRVDLRGTGGGATPVPAAPGGARPVMSVPADAAGPGAPRRCPRRRAAGRRWRTRRARRASRGCAGRGRGRHRATSRVRRAWRC